MMAKTWLKKAEIGDKITFENGTKGIVISGDRIDKSCVVD